MAWFRIVSGSRCFRALDCGWPQVAQTDASQPRALVNGPTATAWLEWGLEPVSEASGHDAEQPPP